MAALQRLRPAAVLGGVAGAGIGLAILSRTMMSEAHADAGAPRKVFGGGPAFVALPLESSEQVNHNTKKLRFKLPQPDAVTGLPLEASLLTFSWPKGRTFPVVRPYTPISPSDEPGYMDLLVKHYPNGKASTHLHSLSPGESLRFMMPLKGYAWTPNKFPHVTLIAGGAGITPMYQMIQGILRDPADHTKVTLVFGVNADADVLLKEEFDRFEKAHPGRFKAVYTVSRPEPGSPYRQGYVTRELLKESIPGSPADHTQVFVCGPPAMETALLGQKGKPGILQQLGYGKDKVHKF